MLPVSMSARDSANRQSLVAPLQFSTWHLRCSKSGDALEEETAESLQCEGLVGLHRRFDVLAHRLQMAVNMIRMKSEYPQRDFNGSVLILLG